MTVRTRERAESEEDFDAGLFGPESVTWRLHAEPVLWVGGVRALFLQALHPLAMAGVAQHSDFRDDVWGRLRRTAEYVGVVTYGTTAEAKAAGERVRGIHRGLTGTEPESGKRYAVADPHLLLWVHCAQVDSFLSTVRRAGVDVSDADADRYVEEQVAAAQVVGIPAERVPRSVAELAQYFEDIRPELAVTAAARRGARFLLLPPMPGKVVAMTPARPAWAGLALIAFSTLPRWARRMYGMPGLPTTDFAANLTAAGLRLLLARIPDQWREGPHLRAARERLAFME